MECLHYAMNSGVDVVITGCDSMDRLQQAILAARTFKPLSQQEVAAILAKTAPVAQAGRFEIYKATTHFDGTTQHPEWMG
jgi:hypothetical protein